MPRPCSRIDAALVPHCEANFRPRRGKLPLPQLRNTAHNLGAGLAARREGVQRPADVEAAPPEAPAILALVDALAVLAADLWFAGELDQFHGEEELPDAEDD